MSASSLPDAADVNVLIPEGDPRSEYTQEPAPVVSPENTSSTIVCTSVELYKQCVTSPSRAALLLIATTVIPGMFGAIWYEIGSTENASSWILWFTGSVHFAHRVWHHDNLLTAWSASRIQAALYMSSQICVIISIVFTSVSPKMSEASLVFASFVGLAFAILGVPLGVFAAAIGYGNEGTLYMELQNAFNSTDAETEMSQLGQAHATACDNQRGAS